MAIISGISLKKYNTFGFDVKAKQYFSITDEKSLLKILKKCYSDEIFVLGGGSNILLTENLDLTVLHLQNKGITLRAENKDNVIVSVKAGENWHQFVRYCVDHDYGGLENLSLIPGNVGTAPIQNIGAYGVEQQDCFFECKAIHRQTLEERIFQKQDCHFGYRNSVFKNRYKNQYIITEVSYRLTKGFHQIYKSYGSIKQELDTMGIEYPTIRNISDAVIAIRERKLPNPKHIGNSGSFFKNPIISKEEFKTLIEAHPQVRYYQVGNSYKIAAGWLIDQLGLKGFREGDVGVHKNQALVLVNHGKATGKEVLDLARDIQKKVKSTYGIDLEMEVNVVPDSL